MGKCFAKSRVTTLVRRWENSVEVVLNSTPLGSQPILLCADRGNNPKTSFQKEILSRGNR